MKTTLLPLLLILTFSSIAQDMVEKNFSRLQQEVHVFIDSQNSQSVGAEKYNTYTLYVYDTGPDTTSIAFYLSYFHRRNRFKKEATKYFFYVDDKLVLANIPKTLAVEWLNRKWIEVLDSSNLITVSNKLPPAHILFWYDGKEARKRHCVHYTKWHNLKVLCTYEYFCDCADFPEVKKSLSPNPGSMRVAPLFYPDWPIDR